MILEILPGVRVDHVRRSDLSSLVEFLSDPQIAAATLHIPHPYTADDARRWFELIERPSRLARPPLHRAIRDDANRMIGGLQLAGASADRLHRAELGYWLARPFWGRGIMTAVVDAVVRHAFEHLGIEKVTAHTLPDNGASSRVLLKCGFQQEGYLKKHFCKDGRLLDALAFGKTR